MTRKSNGLLVLHRGLDTAALTRTLIGLTVQVNPKGAPGAFRLLDCHDQSQAAKGRILIASGGTVHLFQDGGQSCKQKTKARGRFVQDLPDGPVRAALSDFPKLRALTEIGAGEINQQSLIFLDDLQKTVVRGMAMTLTSGAVQVTIVQLLHLRGHKRAFEVARAALVEADGGAFGVDAIFARLYPDRRRYQAKPNISLGKTEPAIQAATDIIRTFLAVARQNEAGITADIDTEFLHDYRVSLRRIRSVLSLFRGVYSDAQTKRLRQEFSGHMSATGRLRDLDVCLLKKEKYFSLLPPHLHAGLQEMFARFEAERHQELTKLSRRFRSADYKQAMQALTYMFQDHRHPKPGPNAEAGAYGYARTLIWKRYRKVCKLARSITPETPDKVVHELRIHCKKLRYLMEFFAPLFDKSAFKTTIKPLKKLQETLGNFNDFSVQQMFLLDFVAQSSTRTGRANGQLAMAVGGLIAVLNQRQQVERDRVITNFRHFDSPKIRRLFHTQFHAPEG